MKDTYTQCLHRLACNMVTQITVNKTIKHYTNHKRLTIRMFEHHTNVLEGYWSNIERHDFGTALWRIWKRTWKFSYQQLLIYSLQLRRIFLPVTGYKKKFRYRRLATVIITRQPAKRRKIQQNNHAYYKLFELILPFVLAKKTTKGEFSKLLKPIRTQGKPIQMKDVGRVRRLIHQNIIVHTCRSSFH